VVEKANLKGINEVFLLKVKESQIYFQKNSWQMGKRDVLYVYTLALIKSEC
jgi:hypothetical protein